MLSVKYAAQTAVDVIEDFAGQVAAWSSRSDLLRATSAVMVTTESRGRSVVNPGGTTLPGVVVNPVVEVITATNAVAS